MKHIFYLIGIGIAIYELYWMFNATVEIENTIKFRTEGWAHRDKPVDDFSSEYKNLLMSKLLPFLIISSWLMIGLFTFNWFMFLVILFWYFGVILPLAKIYKTGLIYTVIHQFNAFISFIFCLFVMINSYHLKIDMFQWFLTWF
jgi:hypothetical protein